jgi:hypothetical protein
MGLQGVEMVTLGFNTPSVNNNNGFNAAATSANPSDRVIATAPTTTAGSVIQLDLTNSSGSLLNPGDVLSISFDTVRYFSVNSANQLPGFWLFASMDGSTWSNVATAASPNPDITTVPNSRGVTSRSVDFVLPIAWDNGATIYFRWVDDNAQQTSPDQIIGLNNVNVVPAPGVGAVLGAGLLAVARRRR